MTAWPILEQNVKIEFARAKYSLYGLEKYMHKNAGKRLICPKLPIKTQKKEVDILQLLFF
jgi:hypothetical protein